MNVAIYLRKSREELEESREETLARHERILLDYCSRNNLFIKKIFKEVVSGESIEKRPQMIQLLDEVRSGYYDGVVVIELERLSRGNQIDQAEILEIFKKSKTKIFTLNKTYDLSSDDEFDEDFFEFGLFMSRREYKIIKRRLIRGKKQAQKEGYYIGCNLPFGYDKEKQGKGWVLIPNENARIVKLVFNKYVNENLTLPQIRDYLNDNGIKPQKARQWTVTLVRFLLQQKVYIGKIACDTKTDNPKYYEGKHEPIIDNDTFDMAQKKLKSNTTKIKKGVEPVNPLATIVKCSKCGYTLNYMTSCGKGYLSCVTLGCNTIGAYVENIEEQILNELKKELEGFNYFLLNYNNEIEEKKKNVQNEIKLIKQEITKKESMIERCCEMLEEGIYTKEKYLSRVNVLEEDLSVLKSNLMDLLNIDIEDNNRIKNAIPVLTKVLDEYKNLSVQNKNLLLKSIIDKIEYTKTERKKRSSKTDNFTLKLFLKI